jgi:hypothetical protein
MELSQKFYGMLCVLEVALRNAVDVHFKTKLQDEEWICNQAQTGFLVDNRDAILKERDKLVDRRRYTHDRLVASLSFGIWTIMFSDRCYKNSGKSILQIFPRKTHGLTQSIIYKELDGIRKFRNRIAHHESLCFDKTGAISVTNAGEIHSWISKYIGFLGFNTNELLFGVESPLPTIKRIEELCGSISNN